MCAKKTANQTKPTLEHVGDASLQDRPSRFIAACATGRIGDDIVERAVTLTVTRTQGHALTWWSDGWRGYATILRRAYRQPVRSGEPGRPPLVVPPPERQRAPICLWCVVGPADAHPRLECTARAIPTL